MSKNINGEGKYVTSTVTSVTTVSINADGKIDKDNVSKLVTVHNEISDGKGDINYENTTASATLKLGDVSQALQTASTSAAAEKGKLGHSPL